MDTANIDKQSLNRMTFVCFKIILYTKEYELKNYDIIVDLEINKIEIINKETNENEFHKLIGRRSIQSARSYLSKIIQIVNSNQLSLDELHNLALTNKGQELQNILHIDNEVVYENVDDHKDSLEEEYYELEEEEYEEIEEEEEETYYSEYAERCPACEEAPCRCSDPDPG